MVDLNFLGYIHIERERESLVDGVMVVDLLT